MHIRFGTAYHIVRLREEGALQPATLEMGQTGRLIRCWQTQNRQLPGNSEVLWHSNLRDILYLDGPESIDFRKRRDRLPILSKDAVDVLKEGFLRTAQKAEALFRNILDANGKPNGYHIVAVHPLRETETPEATVAPATH